MALSYQHVVAARERVAGRVARTPVLRSRSVDEHAGTAVYLKCENFQHGGAFKYRGATNRLLQLSDSERQRGVVAFSSGNHAQAVALAARNLGISADLVMPTDAPRTKLAAVRAFGGRVHLYDRARESRENVAATFIEQERRVLIPPFDDYEIMAGQGTAALELLDEVPELDALVVPVGGGGLVSGCAIATHGKKPAVDVFGVEPATAADVRLSLEQGRPTAITDNPTIADGLRTPQPGELTFPIIQKHVREILTVRDDQMIEAIRLLLFRAKVLAEPSGAAGLAAVLTGTLKKYGRVGVVISGGNIDPEMLAGFLSQSSALSDAPLRSAV